VPVRLGVFLRFRNVSSPPESDRCLVLDLKMCCKPLKIIEIPRELDGVSKISLIALKLAPLGIHGIVVSRIGLEGFRAAREYGLRIYRFTGSMEDLEHALEAGGFEEIDESKIDNRCPCCALNKHVKTT
jgi:predicted Fe-Mo cluster-binding NifX family protein